MVNALVERYGRTGFAALSSVIWFVPMAAWAGSSDLSPIDKTAYPWIALAIGLVMLAVWIVLLTRLSQIAVSTRQRRFDLAQMTKQEKRWTLITAAFITGLIAWLNAAATVDWGPLGNAISAGKQPEALYQYPLSGPIGFVAALAAFALIMIVGIVLSARRANRAYAERISSSRPVAAEATH
jgi:hypothetical protein